MPEYSPPRPIPKRIILIAIVFVYMGLSACWEVLTGLVLGNFIINFAIFMLPVGVGLLRGLPSSRTWASFWIRLGQCIGGFFVLALVVAPSAMTFQWNDAPVYGVRAWTLAFLLVASYLMVLYVFHRWLMSDESDRFFDGGDGPAQPVPA